jgi:hypothetical protein
LGAKGSFAGSFSVSRGQACCPFAARSSEISAY